MSWDGYLTQHVVGAGHVDQAIIIDQTGQAVWGKSPGIELSPQEMNAIAVAFNDATSAQKHGITVEEKKYFYNKIEDVGNIPVLHCAMGKEGIVALRCSQSILVTHYPTTSIPTNAIEFLVAQAKHLISNNL